MVMTTQSAARAPSPTEGEPLEFRQAVQPRESTPAPAPPAAAREAQTLPFSLEAEEAVLGSCLIDQTAFLEIAAFLRPDDFYLLKHSILWDVLSKIYERGEAVDDLTVVEELRARGQLEEIGGPAFLARLINSTPTSLNAETYARIVERGAIRRRLLQAASEIAQAAQDETADINEVMSKAESTLFGVTERSLMRRELIPMNVAISEYYERVEKQYEQRGEPVGLPTGFNDLDNLLGGLQRSDLIIIAARPGVGKTSLMLSMALNAAKLGKKANIAIFSLEMSTEQLVQRLVSAETGINNQKLRTGDLDDREWTLFTQAAGNLGMLHIYIDDTPAITPLQMRTKCRRLQREHGLDLVIVDYLQLMNSGLPRNDNRVQEISFISRNLKELARELSVPLLSAAQLSRQVEQRADKRPQLSDLRESGSIEQDADIVMFIYREDMYDENSERTNQADLLISKHRNGPTGVVTLFFNKALTQFSDLQRHKISVADY
jgi:replicative DNA helicase